MVRKEDVSALTKRKGIVEKNASDVAQYSHAQCKHIDIIGGMNKKSNTSITICEATSATAKQGVEQRGIAVVAAGMLASVATLILVAVTDFIITMTLSAADASAHITHSTESPVGTTSHHRFAHGSRGSILLGFF
ncbi:hypothetical protein ACNHN5_04875 [Corynebacterium diphtheriae]|uniref:hypothetical protein n=3 Tax=Corynebacterium diphtheriae TaxID=1717 RepID=UPI0018EF60FC|nr:hypothetical protein [Corynebacterium diphtheriae]